MTSSNPDYAFLHKLADAADAKTMQHFRSGYEVVNKLEAGFDPVTIADRSAEEAIRAVLEVERPDHGIIGEEYGRTRENAENVWVLDPVDGTRSFICGTPLWGTLIGLRTNGKAVQGIMSQPYNNERFWGNCKEAFMSGPLGERPLRPAVARLCQRRSSPPLSQRSSMKPNAQSGMPFVQKPASPATAQTAMAMPWWRQQALML